MTDNRIKKARAMCEAGEHAVQEIADTLGVWRAPIYRHLDHGAGAPE